MASTSSWSFDFLSFVIGLVVAGFLGNLLQRMRAERGIMGAPDRPMAVPTQGTPNNVRTIARAAFRRFLGLCLLFVISVIVIVTMIYLLMQM